MSDDTQRDNQRSFAPGHGVDRATQQRHSDVGLICEAPDCTNPGGAFTSEWDGRIYEFCSEPCRARFERTPE